MSVNRITPDAIRDLCWLDGIEMERWERRALRAIDRVWMRMRAND